MFEFTELEAGTATTTSACAGGVAAHGVVDMLGAIPAPPRAVVAEVHASLVLSADAHTSVIICGNIFVAL